jgi:hypothetical protein
MAAGLAHSIDNTISSLSFRKAFCVVHSSVSRPQPISPYPYSYPGINTDLDMVETDECDTGTNGGTQSSIPQPSDVSQGSSSQPPARGKWLRVRRGLVGNLVREPGGQGQTSYGSCYQQLAQGLSYRTVQMYPRSLLHWDNFLESRLRVT